MKGPPEKRLLEYFLLRDLGVGDPALFKRVKRARENIIKKGITDLGRKNCIAKEPYLQWIREMTRLIKMSLSVDMLVSPPEPKPTHIPIEEAEELRATIVKLAKENDESHQRLCKVTAERDDLIYKLLQREKELVESQWTASYEAVKRQRIKYGLDTM